MDKKRPPYGSAEAVFEEPRRHGPWNKPTPSWSMLRAALSTLGSEKAPEGSGEIAPSWGPDDLLPVEKVPMAGLQALKAIAGAPLMMGAIKGYDKIFNKHAGALKDLKVAWTSQADRPARDALTILLSDLSEKDPRLRQEMIRRISAQPHVNVRQNPDTGKHELQLYRGRRGAAHIVDEQGRLNAPISVSTNPKVAEQFVLEGDGGSLDSFWVPTDAIAGYLPLVRPRGRYDTEKEVLLKYLPQPHERMPSMGQLPPPPDGKEPWKALNRLWDKNIPRAKHVPPKPPSDPAVVPPQLPVKPDYLPPGQTPPVPTPDLVEEINKAQAKTTALGNLMLNATGPDKSLYYKQYLESLEKVKALQKAYDEAAKNPLTIK